jgi:hypothetical protein
MLITEVFYGTHTPLGVSRDSLVGIVTGYGLNNQEVEVRVPVGSRIFCSPRRPDRLWGPPNHSIQWVPGALAPEVKWLGRETDNSPASAEVKKMWIWRSFISYTLLQVQLE